MSGRQTVRHAVMGVRPAGTRPALVSLADPRPLGRFVRMVGRVLALAVLIGVAGVALGAVLAFGVLCLAPGALLIGAHR